MIEELIKLIEIQEKSLRDLLVLLEVQYKMIIKKDVFGLEGLVEKIGLASKKIAQEEVQRRKITNNESIKKIVNESNNEELKRNYEVINETLKKVIEQKDTNDLLLKQEIMFNNKMLSIMNPDRQIKTYNSYGSLSK